MRHNPRILLAVGLLGAVGFVVLRVVYRVLFGGASTGDTVLPSLAPIRLSGPFSHIVLFGPVTLEGLGQAVVSALPFALVILLTSALVSLWDPRTLIVLAPRLRIGGSLVLATGIAVATFPVVIDSLSRVRAGFALRGMKPGLRAFAPLLERTLERALGIARALESRGIMARRTRLLPSEHSGVIALSSWAISSRLRTSVSWSIETGKAILLTGATGSGKTTLLESIAGVWNLRGGAHSYGTCSVDVAAGDVAYLPHDAVSLFLTSRVGDDVALGLIAEGVSSAEAKKQARDMLGTLGIEDLADRVPAELSSGEVVMCALAVLLVRAPRVLLLDEPLGSLSQSSATRVLGALHAWRAQTHSTVIITDHPRSDTHVAGFEEWMLMPEGIQEGRYHVTPAPSLRAPFRPVEPDVVLSVRSLSVTRGNQHVLRDVSLEITRGETCAIVGDNGAGKSTLLEALATPQENTVWSGLTDLHEMAPAKRVRHVALVPSVPSDLFVATSVGEELERADGAAGVDKGFTHRTLESLLPDVGGKDTTLLDPLQHPRDLSRGQQTALAIALQLSHKPKVLLVDEPMRGLDEVARSALSEVLACVVETGTSVVIATHHLDHTEGAYDRVLTVSGGTLQQVHHEVTP